MEIITDLGYQYPVGIYLLKVNNKNTRPMYKICSKLTPCSIVSIVNFEQAIAGWVGPKYFK